MMRFSGPHAAARSPEGLAAARAATSELRQVIARCAAAGLLADDDIDRFAMQWRAVAHGLAEFENRGLLPTATGRGTRCSPPSSTVTGAAAVFLTLGSNGSTSVPHPRVERLDQRRRAMGGKPDVRVRHV
jgi:hypothetical protein